jgi:hypothetical protein
MSSSANFVYLTGFAAVCIVGIIAAVAAADDPTAATHTLETEGWSDIHVYDSGVATGFEGCSDDDGIYYRATGKNPAGKEAKALVCCGAILKACTVRIE